MTGTTVTAAQLRELGACTEQVNRFVELFGESVEVTTALAVEHASMFDWDWAARNLLPRSLWEQYEAAKRPLWEQYEAAKRPLRKQYEAAEHLLWVQYVAAERPLREQYVAAVRPFWEQYEAAVAELFARLFLETATQGEDE